MSLYLVALAVGLFVLPSRAATIINVPADLPSIQAGIDAAHDGDTVLVAPGTYNENIDFKGKAITVTSGATSFEAAASTVINGAADGPVASFQTRESASATLNGFTLQNGHASVASHARGGGIFINGASPSIRNNLITRNYGCGVLIAGHGSPLLQGNNIKQTLYLPGSPGEVLCSLSSGAGGVSGTGVSIYDAGTITLLRNVIEENATDPGIDIGGQTGAGISVLTADSLTLDSNIIRNNHTFSDSAFGMQIGTPVPRLSFINNLVYGNTTNFPNAVSTVQVLITGAYMTAPSFLVETNNTIYGSGEELLFSFASESVVANNVFVNSYVFDPRVSTSASDVLYSGLACADTEAQASPIQFLNNDIFNFGPPQDGGCPKGTGGMTVDPAFRNPDHSDFREQSSSPLVAKGDSTAPLIPIADLDSKARTVCGTIDIGAYELRPSPAIALTTSANPTPGGSNLTFTSTLAGNCNVPTGTITFLDGSKPIGTAALDSSGTATLSTAFLVVGQHNITATYPGDFNFESSTSDILVQTITGDPTVTTLNVLPNPAAAFGPITLSSVVSSQYGTPTGAVVFLAGGQTLATAALNGAGLASATISTLGAGTYNIVASYTADTRFQPSSSSVVQEVLIGAITISSLNAAPNPAFYGQPVSFSIRVQNTEGSTLPAGTVQLTVGATPLGTAIITAGVGSFTTTALSLGTHIITSTFKGNGNFSPSRASTTETILPMGISISLATTPNPSNTGQAVTMTATGITNSAGSIPAGNVTFRDGLNVLGTVALNTAGTASFTTSSLAVGSHPLQASLSAGAFFLESSSPVVTQTVRPYDFTLSSSRSTLSFPSGDWSTIAVTVTPVGGFDGSVTLGCDDLPAYSQCVVDGGNTVSLAKGAQEVTMTVNASGLYKFGDHVSSAEPPRRSGLRPEAFLGMCLLPVLGLWKWTGKRVPLATLLLLCACVTSLLSLQGCSGKTPEGTVPGSYSIMVTGVDSQGQSLKHALPLQLTITKR